MKPGRVNGPIDASGFDNEYKNGRPGIEPGTLLKPVPCGCSRGKQSSRKIEELSKYSITAKAFTGDIETDHSAAADFVQGNSEKLKKVFTRVLMVCGGLNLIRGEKFTADGHRLPSWAAKEWSGTYGKLRKKKEKFGTLAARLVRLHKENDKKKSKEETEREAETAKKLRKKAEYIKKFLEENRLVL